jgi:hypothetical protein
MQPPSADGYRLTESAPYQSSLFFETPAEIYARVFKDLKPRTETPRICVEFRRYANANSSVRLEDGLLTVRIADILEGAPAPIMEALAYILLGNWCARSAAASSYPDRKGRVTIWRRSSND